MTYSLYDAEDYIGDVATITGLDELRKFVEKNKMEKTLTFLDEGNTEDMDEVIEELSKIKSDDENVASTITNLIDLLGKCDEIAIINDGTSEEKE